MKKYLVFPVMIAALATFGACLSEDDHELRTPEIENPGILGDSGKILVAYFSWGGTTQRMAEEIARQTGADVFRIEPVVPYPTEYTPCTEVAREEKENDARPA